MEQVMEKTAASWTGVKEREGLDPTVLYEA
jgi:hypothetical protein